MPSARRLGTTCGASSGQVQAKNIAGESLEVNGHIIIGKLQQRTGHFAPRTNCKAEHSFKTVFTEYSRGKAYRSS